MQKIEITKNETGRRLDKFLRKYFSAAPLTLIYKMIRKDIKVNGKRVSGDYVLAEGDVVSVYLTDDKFREFKTTRRRGKAKKQFSVIYEDDSIIIVNKPRGLLTHGDGTEKKNHLANQVLSYLIEEGAYDPAADSVYSPAPVNRLDRNTSGLVIFCKNYDAQRKFSAMIRDRVSIGKYYLALVKGRIDGPLELRDSMVRDEVANRTIIVGEGEADVKPDGQAREKSMVTRVRPLKTGRIRGFSSKQVFTLVEIELMTGRTHQIRAQLAADGHPLAGDIKYGDKKINDCFKADFGITTQLLHAYKLTFDDCGDGFDYLNGKSWKSEPPEQFKNVIDKLY